MKFFLLFILLLLNFENLNSQVIEKYKQLIEISTQKDSVYELTYYKEIDSTLKSKLDSFITYIEKDTFFEKPKADFYTVSFKTHSKPFHLLFSQSSKQNDCEMLTRGNIYNYRVTAFAYSFYKNKLIIFTTQNRSIHISDCAVTTLKNLIYEHLDLTEQKNIRNKNEVLVVKSRPAKRFFIY